MRANNQKRVPGNPLNWCLWCWKRPKIVKKLQASSSGESPELGLWCWKQLESSKICRRAVKNEFRGIPWTGVYDAGNLLKLQKFEMCPRKAICWSSQLTRLHKGVAHKGGLTVQYEDDTTLQNCTPKGTYTHMFDFQNSLHSEASHDDRCHIVSKCKLCRVRM